ncbi:PGF-CTERM sorting domain-containing protein [Natronomonas gomsonensis]|uniref:PGF-CTERM sorting domain-containing protein n=1 Tax=Natronomonas gomsonensis TaxID=1046043 RepID=UPI0015C1C3D5|nr:PGF-CTERM sorting domain-containing protein [Natronomonas gomsonensis]
MRRQRRATSLAILVIAGTLAGVSVLTVAAGPAAADEHTKDQAANFDGEANLTVNFPYATDHYPGDQNEANGSIEYFASGAEAFEELNAEEGVFLDYVIIDAQWIDYSNCDIPNTKAFGIDRGGNNDGTQVDEDLVQRQKNVDFRDDGITIELYDFSDFAGDPPYMAPEDAIVAAQGAGSQDGTCLTVTSEPGWYQVQGFLNGTVADNGPGEQPSSGARTAGVKVNSNYLYVCECDNEQQAREQLGPPPGEEPKNTATPEPTTTPESTPTPTEAPDATAAPEPTEASEDTPEPTDPPEDTPQSTAPPKDTTAPTATEADTGGGGNGDTNMTPTAGAGPGFSPAVAVLALLASALLVSRRT